MRIATVVALTMLCIASSVQVASQVPDLGRQRFPLRNAPVTPEDVDRESKRIDEKEIPPLPELLLDEIREADSNIAFLRNSATRPPKIPDAEGLRTKILPMISQISKKPCDSKKVANALNELQSELDRFDNDMDVAINPVSLAKSLSDLLLNVDDPALCKLVGKLDEASLRDALDAYIQNVQSNYKAAKSSFDTNVPLATKLQNVWEKRRAALLKASAGQKKQTTDIFVANLPWIVLIFCLFGLSVIAVIRIFGEQVQMEWVASGQVIQFASVMVLLIVVSSLGILKIIEKEGIGTLLGAIAGYVLSQGVGRAAARAATTATYGSEASGTSTSSAPRHVDPSNTAAKGGIAPASGS